MEIINNFGLDPILLGAQIVNFLIIFYVLKRFLYKPVLGVLRKREDTIKDGLKQAEDGKKLLDDAQKKEKEILKNAQNQSQQMLDDAKTQANELSKQIEDRAKKHADEIILTASEKIDQDLINAEKRLTEHVSRLALEFLEKSTVQLFDEKNQEQIIKTAIEKFRKSN